MRLDINLASQPYEDARQFWARWGTAVGVAGLVTVVLLTMTITGYVNSRRDRKAMAEKRAQIADRDRVRTRAEQFLNQPENRNTRDTSQFLNEQIERKAFSWTRVLENLESLMPPRVHLVSISPGLDEDNQLSLKMTIAGDSWDRALELARRMEASRRFAQVNIPDVRSLQGNVGGDTEQFDIVALYIPEPLAGSDTTTKPADKPVETKAQTKSPSASTAGAKTGAKSSTPKPVAPKGPKH